MDPMRSVFCNGTMIIDANQFVWITMGSGIGYFVIGYLFFRSIYNICKKKFIDSREVITAVQV